MAHSQRANTKAVMKHQGLSCLLVEISAEQLFSVHPSQVDRNLVFSQYRLPCLVSMPQAAWFPENFLTDPELLNVSPNIK